LISVSQGGGKGKKRFLLSAKKKNNGEVRKENLYSPILIESANGTATHIFHVIRGEKKEKEGKKSKFLCWVETRYVSKYTSHSVMMVPAIIRRREKKEGEKKGGYLFVFSWSGMGCMFSIMNTCRLKSFEEKEGRGERSGGGERGGTTMGSGEKKRERSGNSVFNFYQQSLSEWKKGGKKGGKRKRLCWRMMEPLKGGKKREGTQ